MHTSHIPNLQMPRKHLRVLPSGRDLASSPARLHSSGEALALYAVLFLHPQWEVSRTYRSATAHMSIQTSKETLRSTNTGRPEDLRAVRPKA